jgi:hypothetical protein
MGGARCAKKGFKFGLHRHLHPAEYQELCSCLWDLASACLFMSAVIAKIDAIVLVLSPKVMKSFGFAAMLLIRKSAVDWWRTCITGRFDYRDAST